MSNKKECTRLNRIMALEIAKLDKLESFASGIDLESENSGTIGNRLCDLEKCFAGFSKVVEDLCAVISDDEFLVLQERVDLVEDRYHNTRSILKSGINRKKCDYSKTVISTDSQSSSLSPNQLGIKIPSIQLPTFNGDFKSWTTFRDTFVSIVHNNIELNDILKFTFLLNNLKGSVRESIGQVSMTSEAYHRTWNSLCERFDNESLIIESYIEQLLAIPNLTKECAYELRKLINICTASLNSLGACKLEVVGLAEQLVVKIIKDKLDVTTRKEWDKEAPLKELPRWEQLIQFLNKRCHLLETLQVSKIVNNRQNQRPQHNNRSVLTTVQKSSNISCYLCKGNHLIFYCPKFGAMSIDDRFNFVKRAKCCTNCLSNTHNVASCQKASGCKKCGLRHNTMLHKIVSNNFDSKPLHIATNTDSQPEADEQPRQTMTIQNTKTQQRVLLSTAVVLIKSKKGEYHTGRALLDSGSQCHFITSEFANRLGLDRKVCNTPVSGIQNCTSTIKYNVHSRIKSRVSRYQKDLQFLVTNKIAGFMPTSTIDISKWSIPSQIQLADPFFNVSNKIDLLLGAGIYLDMLKQNKIHTSHHMPIIQDSQFGWILNGNYDEPLYNFSIAISSETDEISISKLLTKFWEVDNLPSTTFLSKEEKMCEDHFTATHYRDPTGRFVVSLPFKESVSNLGLSKNQALKRFNFLERKLNQDTELKRQYIDFINEYLTLQHMKLSKDQNDESGYFLPHHAVLKPTSSTTKLRVVFDASAKTTSNISLNDILLTGANVQDNMFSIILRFRKYKYVFLSDISKMYRQITLNPNDTKFHKILWRSDPNDTIKVYELTTVTYGTASAPFLATRALKQLIVQERETFKDAAQVALSNFYVDDLLAGFDTIEDALCVQSQLIQMLEKGGFSLHKWSSNTPELLKNIPEGQREQVDIFSDTNSIKTLGLLWQPSTDEFFFKSQTISFHKGMSKRTVLSDMCKLFDPIGLISPVIMTAKLLVQKLWKDKLDWDTPLSEVDKTVWLEFRENLNILDSMNLKLHIILPQATLLELHGFADASQKAYGACVYIRSTNSNGDIFTSLVCSKSRVSPMKFLTIARLELCAALLLSNLITTVIETLDIKFNSVNLWSDSQIVLAWLKLEPSKLKTFIANRVSQIQEMTVNYSWRYVPTVLNPADIISRGIMPQVLLANQLWWHGPDFLKFDISGWPVDQIDHTIELPEQKTNVSMLLCDLDNNAEFDIFTRYSDFNKLIRVTAFCLRFKNNCVSKALRMNHKSNILSTNEIVESHNVLIKLVQSYSFKSEIKMLKSNLEISPASKIRSLNPFLDKDGVIRVGGRLKNTDLEFNTKHQILLPNKHPFVVLLSDTSTHKIFTQDNNF